MGYKRKNFSSKLFCLAGIQDKSGGFCVGFTSKKDIFIFSCIFKYIFMFLLNYEHFDQLHDTSDLSFHSKQVTISGEGYYSNQTKKNHIIPLSHLRSQALIPGHSPPGPGYPNAISYHVLPHFLCPSQALFSRPTTFTSA